jgi:hypothetical protein
MVRIKAHTSRDFGTDVGLGWPYFAEMLDNKFCLNFSAKDGVSSSFGVCKEGGFTDVSIFGDAFIGRDGVIESAVGITRG